MGYIPPIRDEQVRIYHHRQLATPMDLPPSPSVQPIEFFDALKDEKNHLSYKKQSESPIHELARQFENEITGKGTLFDEKT